MATPASQKYEMQSAIQAPNILWLRIGGLLVFVVAMVLLLISYLNYSNYRKSLVELNLTRNLVLAKDVRQTIESGLNIGLRPAQNENLRPAIAVIAASHPGIRYIAVINEVGEVSGEGALPALAPAAWKTMLNNTEIESYWHAGDNVTAQVGVIFVNGFNIRIGAVVIAYDMTAVELSAHAMLWKLVADTLLTLALMAVITLVAVYFLTRQFTRDLKVVGANISGTLQADLPAPLPEQVLEHDVAAGINDFSVLSHNMGRKLAWLEAGITQGRP